jgi:hypothetical protein
VGPVRLRDGAVAAVSNGVRDSRKPDRREVVRLPLRRLDDKTHAIVTTRLREMMDRPTFIDCRGIGPVGKVTR